MVKPYDATHALYFLTDDSFCMHLASSKEHAEIALNVWQKRIGKSAIKYHIITDRPYSNPFPKVLVRAVTGHWRRHRYTKSLTRKDRIRLTYDYIFE